MSQKLPALTLKSTGVLNPLTQHPFLSIRSFIRLTNRYNFMLLFLRKYSELSYFLSSKSLCRFFSRIRASSQLVSLERTVEASLKALLKASSNLELIAQVEKAKTEKSFISFFFGSCVSPC